MSATTAPEAALSVLPRADGSAKYSYAGYTVTASVNGPIEAQRMDEHAQEAHVDVIVRPAAGVGGECRHRMIWCTAANWGFLYRHARAAPRVPSAVLTFAAHFGQKLSSYAHPGRSPSRGNPRK